MAQTTIARREARERAQQKEAARVSPYVRQALANLPPPAADGCWGQAEIAEAAGVARGTVKRWAANREEAIREGRPLDISSLPVPDWVTAEGWPRYSPAQIVWWLQSTGRMTRDGRPVRRTSGGGRARRRR